MITSLPSCCAGPNIVVHSSEETEAPERRSQARMLPITVPMDNGREDTNLNLDSPDKRVQAAEDIHYGPAGVVRKGATGTVAGMLKGANGGCPHILVNWDAFPQLSKVSVNHEQIHFISPELPGPYVITHEAGVTRSVTLSRDTLGIIQVGKTIQVLEVLHIKQEKRWRGRVQEPLSGWISLLATDSGHRWAVQEHILPTLAPAEVSNWNSVANGNSQAPAAGAPMMQVTINQQPHQRPRNGVTLPHTASFTCAGGPSHHGQGASAPSRTPSTSLGGSRPGACVRTSSFESEFSVRSGHSSVSMNSLPAYYPAVTRGSRANSLPASLHGSVHFSVDGQPLARVPSSESFVRQAADSLRPLSTQFDDPSRWEERYSSSSLNAQVHQRSNPHSARSSATGNSSWAPGGCATVPEGPRVSPSSVKSEKGQVMALGAQPGGPRGTSSDSRLGSEVYV